MLQVLIEFKVKVTSFSHDHHQQLKNYLVALRNDGLNVSYGLLISFPAEQPMVNDTAHWTDEMACYSFTGHREYKLDTVSEHILDNYRIFKSKFFVMLIRQVV